MKIVIDDADRNRSLTYAKSQLSRWIGGQASVNNADVCRSQSRCQLRSRTRGIAVHCVILDICNTWSRFIACRPIRAPVGCAGR